MLTPEVELTNYKGRSGWLGKDTNTREISVYISGSRGNKQEKSRKEIKSITDGPANIIAAETKNLCGKQTGHKAAGSRVAKATAAALIAIRNVTPDVKCKKGMCFVGQTEIWYGDGSRGPLQKSSVRSAALEKCLSFRLAQSGSAARASSSSA